MFYEQGIHAHHAGFGMWEVDEANGEGWAYEQDLLDAITAHVEEIAELGGDGWIEGMQDIRGKIYHEPARVFAVRTEPGGEVSYLGIIER